MANKKRKAKIQYTKKAMTCILIVALFDLQIPYVLSFIGKENTLEDLSKTVVIEIIGVFLVYCVKSFFETKEEYEIVSSVNVETETSAGVIIFTVSP